MSSTNTTDLPVPCSSASPGSIRTFVFIWVGQFASAIGSGLTGFALGVWVYMRTQSVTDFALICLATVLPAVLLSPLAGALVDRWDRRRTMILSDSASGLCTVMIVLVLLADRLEIWHIWIAMAVSSLFRSLQVPAYTAAITLLVPKKHFARANGAVQLGSAAMHILSPVLAGALFVTIGLAGVILIDVGTFLFAVTTLMLVRTPPTPVSAEGLAAKGSLIAEARYGLTFILARPALVRLLAFFACLTLCFGLAYALLTPLILTFSSPDVLGAIISTGSIGLLAGGAVMSLWGGPARRMHGVLGGAILFGLSMVPVGLRQDPLVLTISLFAGLFSLAISAGCFLAIWQSKVPPDLQGRVFAVRNMLACATVPVGFLVAGPLANRVFAQMLAPQGLLVGTLGRIVGTHKGSEMALMFLVTGTILASISLAACFISRLRLLEDRIPDTIGDTPPGHNEAQV